MIWLFLTFYNCLSEVEGGEKGGRKRGGDEQSSPLKKRNPVINAAKILKRTLSRHNLLSSTSESTEAQTPNQQTLTNGHEAPADAPAGTEQDGSSNNSHHQAEVVSPKHIRKKDNCPLATVTEETSGDGETGSLTDNRYHYLMHINQFEVVDDTYRSILKPVVLKLCQTSVISVCPVRNHITL